MVQSHNPKSNISAAKLRAKAARAATYARGQAMEAGMSRTDAIREGERIRQEVLTEGMVKRADAVALAEARLIIEAAGYKIVRAKGAAEMETTPPEVLMAYILATRTVDAFDPEQRGEVVPDDWATTFQTPRVPALIASIRSWPRDDSHDWHAFYPCVVMAAREYSAKHLGTKFAFGSRKRLAESMAAHFDPDGWEAGNMGWEMLTK